MRKKFKKIIPFIALAVFFSLLELRAQELSSLEHDTGHGKYNSLCQVDSDTYALAYASGDDDALITTFTISADGSTITEVASLEHDTGRPDDGMDNSLVQVDSDTYALAYA